MAGRQHSTPNGGRGSPPDPHPGGWHSAPFSRWDWWPPPVVRRQRPPCRTPRAPDRRQPRCPPPSLGRRPTPPWGGFWSTRRERPCTALPPTRTGRARAPVPVPNSGPHLSSPPARSRKQPAVWWASSLPPSGPTGPPRSPTTGPRCTPSAGTRRLAPLPDRGSRGSGSW